MYDQREISGKNVNEQSQCVDEPREPEKEPKDDGDDRLCTEAVFSILRCINAKHIPCSQPFFT